MGKLMDRLQRQLKNPDTKKDAEDCIKIYNWIKDTDPSICLIANPLVTCSVLNRKT